jgi:AraC-like DNA-binding protein
LNKRDTLRHSQDTKSHAAPSGVRSLVRPFGVAAPFVHQRFPVAGELEAQCAEHFWSVSWSLPKGASHLQCTLPFPSVHIVVDTSKSRGRARIVGISSRRFCAHLRGQHSVFGIKFRPGAFYAIWGSSVSALRDRECPLDELVGPRARDYSRAIVAATHDEARLAAGQALLTEIARPAPEFVVRLQQVIKVMATDRSILRVEDVAQRFQIEKRTLQRWFIEAVGVSPKWVIQRYRLHEALARLDGLQSTAAPGTLTRLAMELGYADSGHFSREFKAFVGLSPSKYLKGC